jgi:prepilin peptidase CpaA
MQALAWWASVVVLVTASAIDVRTRRVPNWLALPFLASGLVAQSISGRLPGAGRSLAGIALAGLFFGVPCLLGAMGMGDLKLAAGVGAWVGPGQFLMASILTGITGAILAVGWALWHHSLGASLDSTADLLDGRWKFQTGAEKAVPRRVVQKENSIPYAPAIAIGALLSFLAR